MDVTRWSREHPKWRLGRTTCYRCCLCAHQIQLYFGRLDLHMQVLAQQQIFPYVQEPIIVREANQFRQRLHELVENWKIHHFKAEREGPCTATVDMVRAMTIYIEQEAVEPWPSATFISHTRDIEQELDDVIVPE